MEHMMGSKRLFFQFVVGLVIFGASGTSVANAQPTTALTATVLPNGVLAASWSIPYSGVEPAVIEAAKGSGADSDGYFYGWNLVELDPLSPGQTSYLGNYELPYGTFYVHVGSVDVPCFYAGLCPVREFSQTVLVTHSPSARPAPQAPSRLPSPTAPPPVIEEAAGITTLSTAQAKRYIRMAAKRRLGKYPKKLKRSCKRRSNTRMRCKVRWSTKRKRYRGTMTIWTKRKSSKVRLYYKFRGTSTKKKCKSKRRSKCKRKVRWG